MDPEISRCQNHFQRKRFGTVKISAQGFFCHVIQAGGFIIRKNLGVPYPIQAQSFGFIPVIFLLLFVKSPQGIITFQCFCNQSLQNGITCLLAYGKISEVNCPSSQFLHTDSPGTDIVFFNFLPCFLHELGKLFFDNPVQDWIKGSFPFPDITQILQLLQDILQMCRILDFRSLSQQFPPSVHPAFQYIKVFRHFQRRINPTEDTYRDTGNQ